jgi:hypothetical protein
VWRHNLQKIFQIWNLEMLFPAFWASKK